MIDLSRPYENRPKEPEEEWPHCKICGEKCFSNPGYECDDCYEYPLCNWCSVQKNCCMDMINPKPDWSDDKKFSKPVADISDIVRGNRSRVKRTKTNEV